MRILKICLTMIIIQLLVCGLGCSKGDREIKPAQLQKRGDDLYYAVNEEKPYSGKVVELYGSGQKRSEISYKNGAIDGQWISWHVNGQKKEQITYKAGQRSGKYTAWYSNGQKQKEGVYSSGSQTGQWSYWSRNGEKRETAVMTGNDGKRYMTVKIGGQWWMAENLKETQYRDGTAIPNVKGASQWADSSTGARCAYNNSETTANTYGYLYNWYAVADARHIAPAGWHVPTEEDWDTLEDYLGDDAGSKLADNASLWEEYDDLRQNASFGQSGFSALPGGYRTCGGGFWFTLGYYANFWSSTEESSYHGCTRYLTSLSSGVHHSYDGRSKQHGFSVRLVRD
jgi:uncharacterized protein (TIGR02145 family)